MSGADAAGQHEQSQEALHEYSLGWGRRNERGVRRAEAGLVEDRIELVRHDRLKAAINALAAELTLQCDYTAQPPPRRRRR